jgi:serine/arginine repetitive matrix protein 2
LAPPKAKKANQAILEHDRLRKIELQLVVYREQLEERNYPAADIEKKVAEKRKEVEKQMKRSLTKEDLTDTHSLSQAKEFENEKLRKAFGIKDDFVEGAAFKQLEDKRGGLGQSSAPGYPSLFGAPVDKKKAKEEKDLKMPSKFLDRDGDDRSEVPAPRGKRDRREPVEEKAVSETRDTRRDRLEAEEPPSRRPRRDDDSERRREGEREGSRNDRARDSDRVSSNITRDSDRGGSSSTRSSRDERRDDRYSSSSRRRSRSDSRNRRSSRRSRSRSPVKVSRSLRADGDEKVVVASDVKLVASDGSGSESESSKPNKSRGSSQKETGAIKSQSRRSKSSSGSSSDSSSSGSSSSGSSSDSSSDSD